MTQKIWTLKRNNSAVIAVMQLLKITENMQINNVCEQEETIIK